ncbi:MAG: hypothetical protein ACL93V_00160 [Candidatus Electrothrix sp. YB6]
MRGQKCVAVADLVVGAALVPGGKTPILIGRQMPGIRPGRIRCLCQTDCRTCCYA